MKENITHVGLDAHMETIHAAILLPGSQESVLDSFANTPDGIRRFARRIKQRAPGPIESCYEAAPLGFGLQRSLISLGLGDVVIAPSLIPKKPGERFKTDRRDARKLAVLFRAGLLTEVHPPSPEQEAVRDLCRACEAAKEEQKRSAPSIVKVSLATTDPLDPGTQGVDPSASGMAARTTPSLPSGPGDPGRSSSGPRATRGSAVCLR